MSKLKAWPNGQGFDYRDWELVQAQDGTWSAAQKPAWFGGTSRVGRGATYRDAIMNAGITDEFSAYGSKMSR